MFSWITDIIKDNYDLFSSLPNERVCNEVFIGDNGYYTFEIRSWGRILFIAFSSCMTGRTILSFTLSEDPSDELMIYKMYNNNNKEKYCPNTKYPIRDDYFSESTRFALVGNIINIRSFGINCLYYEQNTEDGFVEVGNEKFLIIPFDMEEDEYFQNVLIYDIPQYELVKSIYELGKYTSLNTKIENLMIHMDISEKEKQMISSKIKFYGKKKHVQTNN